MQNGINSPLSEFFRQINITTLRIPSIRITDVIDIVLVALLIYIVIHWIKETRAWTLFRGLIIIVIVSMLSYYLHFYTLTWIIEKTLSVGVIAVIIIFQPELRKALEQIGTGAVTGVSGILSTPVTGGKITAETANEIYKACVNLSAERTGALIVIEQHVPMGDVAKSTGVNIDGDVSAQLLQNIFVNKTPLHDGAAIIRNNKIAAASCILPVTQKEIGQELGTRHRAAVGGSENSDAYFIVVSEETGKISIAKEGRLRKGVSAQELKATLEKIADGGKSPAININMIWKGKGKNEK
ncbi:MAG: diadenylate cyclase CdaA [Clostridia bacterium]|nr:diadenylate cyclase CdaA [Clostridia bacterium]